MDMDTEALRWFQQVVDGVTVTEVADVVGVSQPGVSRALARLEAEVGTPLLHRTGRTLRPTHAGTVFKRHVDAALHDLDDALAAVTELVEPETGTVTLAFQLSLGTWLVPALVSTFRAAHPRVRFRLRDSEDAEGSPLVTEGRVDLELTARRPTDPDTHWERLFSQALALAVPPGHRLAGRDAVSIADGGGRGLRDAAAHVGAAGPDGVVVRVGRVRPAGLPGGRRPARGARPRRGGPRGRGRPGARRRRRGRARSRDRGRGRPAGRPERPGRAT